ncbi:hypothetical protein S7711_07063 [Stachybotrys chartarum IBT 7711]|uniref:Uncharacterized protein n=1 Tax=Stachybotrys chartarum (strain CBS 109288 / IBT 7711) TaxID=1280523 RepID=A0A084AP59_STACB|nr:hypothetical protein S7711_07063 [Stachybotrys chartarum IBT 7711]
MAPTAVYQSICLGLDSVNAPRFQSQSQTQTALAPARFVKRDVKAALCFLKDNEDGSPPHSAYIDRLETLDPPCLTYDMTIDDVCGQEDKYTMDGQDFRICRLPAAEKTFRDDEIKASTGASRIFVFNHTIRCEDPNTAESTANHGPVPRLHIEQSYSAARSRPSPRRCS